MELFTEADGVGATAATLPLVIELLVSAAPPRVVSLILSQA
jgi:hypothetical protein